MIAYRNFISEPSPAASSSAGPSAALPCGVPAAVPFSERRSEGADNARIRPLTGVALFMPSERGRNRPAVCKAAQRGKLRRTRYELTTRSQEWAKAAIGIVAGVALVLFVEVCALFHFGFIRRIDPQAAQRAELDAAYSMIAATGAEE